jgi:hypothetical protein
MFIYYYAKVTPRFSNGGEETKGKDLSAHGECLSIVLWAGTRTLQKQVEFSIYRK